MSTPATPPGLHLFTSNRLEILAGKLAARLRAPLASPLAAEIIVVRNKGMERWLKLELARAWGVCANVAFEFPEEFMRRLFRLALPDAPSETRWQRETLTWRIAAALPGLQERPVFAPVRHYLGGGDERKLLQLAGRLAHLFDQYLVFRPEMILAWDAGTETQDSSAAWQAELWRAVSTDVPGAHPAALARGCAEALGGGGPASDGLPDRVTVFGVSALPPFHLDMLAALAVRAQVNLFLLQPSQEYWGDITSPREEERIRRRALRPDEAAFDLHLESGNRLLASLGYLGRDFLKLLLGAGDWTPDEQFAEPGEDSLLHCLQSDLLHLRDRGGAAGDAARTPVARGDDSLQVHSCHSPLRELEVLHDHILDWLERDPALTPRDIVVLMPDVETYAPFVQAVFGSTEEGRRQIPFSVADRGARRESHVVETFLQLLALPDTRLGAGIVLAPLDTAAVRQRFGFTERDVETVREWVRDTNIRWGRDGAHRAAMGLPAFDANTWRAGLDRLVLGHAMAPDDGQLFENILPFEAIEGEAAAVAGRLAEYAELVFALVAALQERRSLERWAELLERALSDFFAAGENTELELQLLRGALAGVRQQQRLAGFGHAVGLGALRERLEPALEEDLQHAGFLTGGVTFCGFKPMRSIPFQIVCLVGMNDGAFPRPVPRLSFDLMAQSPRLGDRSTREDDRYLFLETLLSARRRLYLSYVGRDIRDNRPAPPSVLVSELLDAVDRGFKPDAGERESLRAQLVTQHRLQAFHEDYFRAGGRLFSYSTANARACELARRERARTGPFAPQALDEPEATFREVTLEALTAFLLNPSRFFLNRRLGIFLPESDSDVEEREPFLIEGLPGYQVKQELLEQLQAHEPESQVRARHAAAGALPLGTVGNIDFRRAHGRAAAFHEWLRARGLLDWIEPLEIDLAAGPFRLTGRVAPRTVSSPLAFRCARLKARDLLRAWVTHLAACAVGTPVETILVADGEARRFRPVADAGAELERLLQLYWRGLREPLRFFPETSLAFAEALFARQRASGIRWNARSPLEKARSAWEGNERAGGPGERNEPHFAQCFRDATALEVEFELLATQVFGPLLKVQTREEW